MAQLAIRRIKTDGKGRNVDTALKGSRPLPNFQPLSSVINPDFVDVITEQKIDFVEILLIADFLIHFDLVDMRKLTEDEEYSNAEYQHVTFDLIHKLLIGDSIAAASIFSKLLPDNLPDRKYCGLTVYVSLKLKECAWPALVQWDLLKNPIDRLVRFQEMIAIIIEMEENRTKV